VAYTFPPYRFDAQGQLWRGTDEVPLTAKASAMLARLLAGAGTWVSKPAIMAAVWPDAHVQADNVKVLIREIRQALADTARTPTFIRSARSRGYAFIAPVNCERADARVDPSAPPAPCFVNRGAELAALADAMDAARASLRRIVLFCGERGAGKTAICESFVRALPMSEPAHVTFGRSSDLESQTPFYPFFEALLGLDREEPGLVRSTLRAHAPSWFARVPPWMGAGAPTEDGLPRLEELENALRVLSDDGPLVIVLEDLQCADAASIHALRRLACDRTPAKLLIVATCCCERGWTAGARARNQLLCTLSEQEGSSILPVGPLSEEHVYRYLSARLGPGCPAELASAVREATDGNAYMMVAVVDSLVEGGLMANGERGWRLTDVAGMTAASLADVLAAAVRRRVDSMDPAEREVLEAGALIGMVFKASSVAVATGSKVASARTLLDLVARRGDLILTVNEGESRGSDPTYRFRHARYPGVIGDSAPWLRHIRVSARIEQAQVLRRA
jgi:DNA-binding winged helix-turn-helix (wHTH) protein